MERQRQRARRRLGIAPGEHCAFPNCVEDDPLALTGTRSDLLCYEHRAVRQGRSSVEAHHPATRAIDPAFTVPLYGDDHRIVTVMSRRWLDVIKNVKDNALQRRLGSFFSLRDVERQMVERSGTVDDVILDILGWLHTDHPGWEQDLERWRASRERRDK